jgi:hypothetical protein
MEKNSLAPGVDWEQLFGSRARELKQSLPAILPPKA